MEEEATEEGVGHPQNVVRGRHIKKRALKNKALTVSFNEKDLSNFLTGFHKRKKKRRKEAQRQQQEAERRKRIELRKKRKQDREYALYGETPPDADAEPMEGDEENEQEEKEGGEEEFSEEEGTEALPSVSGTTMYDNGDVKVMVTTSEISREDDYSNPKAAREPEDDYSNPKAEALPKLTTASGKKHSVPVVKKIKKVEKRRSRPKPQSKRDKKKGKKRNNKRR